MYQLQREERVPSDTSEHFVCSPIVDSFEEHQSGNCTRSVLKNMPVPFNRSPSHIIKYQGNVQAFKTIDHLVEVVTWESGVC